MIKLYTLAACLSLALGWFGTGALLANAPQDNPAAMAAR